MFRSSSVWISPLLGNRVPPYAHIWKNDFLRWPAQEKRFLALSVDRLLEIFIGSLIQQVEAGPTLRLLGWGRHSRTFLPQFSVLWAMLCPLLLQLNICKGVFSNMCLIFRTLKGRWTSRRSPSRRCRASLRPCTCKPARTRRALSLSARYAMDTSKILTSSAITCNGSTKWRSIPRWSTIDPLSIVKSVNSGILLMLSCYFRLKTMKLSQCKTIKI